VCGVKVTGLHSLVGIVCDGLAIEDFLKQYNNRNYKFEMADIHGYTLSSEREMDGIKLSYSEKELSLTVTFHIKDTVDATNIFRGYTDGHLTTTEVQINDFSLNLANQSMESSLRDIHFFLKKKNVLYAVASDENVFRAM
jgi:hypothetical protein